MLLKTKFEIVYITFSSFTLQMGLHIVNEFGKQSCHFVYVINYCKTMRIFSFILQISFYVFRNLIGFCVLRWLISDRRSGHPLRILRGIK